MSLETQLPAQNQRIVQQVVRTPKQGYMGQLAAASATLYTAPSLTSSPTGTATCTASLRGLNVCNCDTVSRTFTMYVVESGGSAADDRAIFKDVTIAAKTTLFFLWGADAMPMADGTTLRGFADSANKVTVRVSVEELTY